MLTQTALGLGWFLAEVMVWMLPKLSCLQHGMHHSIKRRNKGCVMWVSESRSETKVEEMETFQCERVTCFA